MTVPVEGTWEGPARRFPGAPADLVPPFVVDRRDLDGGGVAVPLRAMPRWAPVLLGVLGTTLVLVFVWAVVTAVTGPPRAGAPVGLVLLGLFAVLGGCFLAAVPSTVRAAAPGRRWLLTPHGIVTTSITVPWDAVASVQRQDLVWSSRLRTRHQHLLSVALRPEVDADDLPGIAQSPFASAVLDRSRHRVVALGDTRLLAVDPEALAQAIALLASRPDLRALLTDDRGARLVETGSTA